MAKEKITFRIDPLLAAALRIEAEQEYRKNSEMLRVVLEQAAETLPELPPPVRNRPAQRRRGEGMSVYLEPLLAEKLRRACEGWEMEKGCTLNQMVNLILRMRYGQDG